MWLMDRGIFRREAIEFQRRRITGTLQLTRQTGLLLAGTLFFALSVLFFAGLGLVGFGVVNARCAADSGKVSGAQEPLHRAPNADRPSADVWAQCSETRQTLFELLARQVPH